jgi:Transcription factor TFIID (or TATA-binding protein, TBP)
MDPVRELEIELMGAIEEPKIRKFQKLWRSKRVFTNSQGGWKLSPAILTAKIVKIKTPVKMIELFDGTPKYIDELMGYKGTGKKPVARWTPGRPVIGDEIGITRAVAKKGSQTIVLTKDAVEVLGLGNWETAVLALARNGWISASNVKKSGEPTYKKIDGMFTVNKDLNLDGLQRELKKVPGIEVSPRDPQFPALVAKTRDPVLTFQFFENGNVLFTGIKNPDHKDTPRKVFKEFFTKHGLDPSKCIELTNRPKIARPKKNINSETKLRLASRYKFAGRWNALQKPPPGYYIRPGTNGAARFYPYRKMGFREATGQEVNEGPMNLTAVAPKVVKAFQNAGQPIPNSTREIFERAGYPLNNSGPKSPKGKAHANRRAPSWNATKPGFYVRPGPGRQPYWFKIPEGLASGRKTVIKTYTEAGRNIPKAVRNIFKIPNSVQINVAPNHRVTMGLNGILRINNRQATRLTVKELVQIAHNMNIPQVNSKMKPATIMQYIQNKAGAHKANRTADVVVNGVYYTFMNNGRVKKTQANGTQTQRAWSTIPSDERKKIANAFLPANLRSEWNTLPNANKFNALRALRKRPSPPKKKTPSPASSVSSINVAEFQRVVNEEKYKTLLANALGPNYFRNSNVQNLLSKLNGLPSGSRGKPLKATIDKAIKNFVKETLIRRRQNIIRENYARRISVPNWIPSNKKNAYKTALLNIATTPNAKGKYPAQKDVKNAMAAWARATLPMAGRAAHEKENIVTGEIIKIPAWNPPKNMKFNVPKRLSPAKKPKHT